MPIELDDYDISILKSLFEDDRKSFRQISRETGITTPTVKARFERLVNVDFIRRVIKQANNYYNHDSIQQFKKIKNG
jgi:Lrp/AsnC family leucine-responsive transcriptional regulator